MARFAVIGFLFRFGFGGHWGVELDERGATESKNEGESESEIESKPHAIVFRSVCRHFINYYVYYSVSPYCLGN